MTTHPKIRAAPRRLAVDPANPDPEAVAEAARVLAAGGLVAYPTEHLYALGCRPSDPKALARLAALKGTPAPKPLLLAIAAKADAPFWTRQVPTHAAELFGAWPEGLTLVLTARTGLPEGVTGGGTTIALRLVRTPVAAALIRAAGGALPATSANPAGAPATGNPDRVAESLPDVDLLLDAGVLPPGGPSTLLDVTEAPWRVLRAGVVPVEAIAAFGPVAA